MKHILRGQHPHVRASEVFGITHTKSHEVLYFNFKDGYIISDDDYDKNDPLIATLYFISNNHKESFIKLIKELDLKVTKDFGNHGDGWYTSWMLSWKHW